MLGPAPQTGFSSWGVQPERVSVRDLSMGAPEQGTCDFLAAGQWLGCQPPTSNVPNNSTAAQGAAASSQLGGPWGAAPGGAGAGASKQLVPIGTQAIRLLPAGMVAATFNARWVCLGECGGSGSLDLLLALAQGTFRCLGARPLPLTCSTRTMAMQAKLSHISWTRVMFWTRLERTRVVVGRHFPFTTAMPSCVPHVCVLIIFLASPQFARHRDVGVLKAVHLRHDAPRAWPGWEVEGATLFVTDLARPGAAAKVHQLPPSMDPAGLGAIGTAATGAVAPTPAAAPSPQQPTGYTLTGQLGPPPEGPAGAGTGVLGTAGKQGALFSQGTGETNSRVPRVYTATPASPPNDVWPAPEAPYIRHLLTHEAVMFGEGVQQYFVPPIITTSAPGGPRPAAPTVDPLAPRLLNAAEAWAPVDGTAGRGPGVLRTADHVGVLLYHFARHMICVLFSAPAPMKCCCTDGR